jgi:hypothetical protein
MAVTTIAAGAQILAFELQDARCFIANLDFLPLFDGKLSS